MEHAVKLNIFEDRLKSVCAEDIMTKSIISVKEDMLLSELADIMIEKRISGAPVMDKEGKLTGIITATDLFHIIHMIRAADFIENSQSVISNPTVGRMMSTNVVAIKKDTPLGEIIEIMKGRDIHTLPVAEGGKLIGVIGRRDVFKIFYSILDEVNSKG